MPFTEDTPPDEEPTPKPPRPPRKGKRESRT